MEEGQREGEQRGEKVGNEGVFITKEPSPMQRCPVSAFSLTSSKPDHMLVAG